MSNNVGRETEAGGVENRLGKECGLLSLCLLSICQENVQFCLSEGKAGQESLRRSDVWQSLPLLVLYGMARSLFHTLFPHL